MEVQHRRPDSTDRLRALLESLVAWDVLDHRMISHPMNQSP